MAAGVISADRADVIAGRTAGLSDADAARADEVLAPIAPGLRVDQLARRAAALEMKLDPEAVRARKEHARRTRQRVEVRREDSGNACIAGRELDTDRRPGVEGLHRRPRRPDPQLRPGRRAPCLRSGPAS